MAISHAKKLQGLGSLRCALSCQVTDGRIPKYAGTRIPGWISESAMPAWELALQKSQSLSPLYKHITSLGTFGIFYLLLLLFAYASLKSMLAKSKMAFFNSNLVIMMF